MSLRPRWDPHEVVLKTRSVSSTAILVQTTWREPTQSKHNMSMSLRGWYPERVLFQEQQSRGVFTSCPVSFGLNKNSPWFRSFQLVWIQTSERLIWSETSLKRRSRFASKPTLVPFGWCVKATVPWFQPVLKWHISLEQASVATDITGNVILLCIVASLVVLSSDHQANVSRSPDAFSQIVFNVAKQHSGRVSPPLRSPSSSIWTHTTNCSMWPQSTTSL